MSLSPTNIDPACSAVAQRQKLVEILEKYLADLEKGVVQDRQELIAAHPEFAQELPPYLESLQLISVATRDLRTTNVGQTGSRRESATPELKRLGDYRIIREIGRGGMGIVYEAHQESLNRHVALKMLPFAAVLDQRQIARFRNEAQAAAQLHHPHIVPVFAVGQEHGVYFYAMQYIAGQSLDQAIHEMRSATAEKIATTTTACDAAKGSTTTLQHEQTPTAAGKFSKVNRGDYFRSVARLGRQAAEALQHAHENGIVHRDVKPSNLLLDGAGQLWVTDFGLAQMQNEKGVTLTGDVIGTLRYMSPEQAGGSTVIDARTDIYSLGATLYELLTLQLAHPADDRQALLRQIVDAEPVAPRRHNPSIPLDLETIILSALAKSPADRYVSAQSLADDLGRFLEGKPTLARRPTLVDRAGKWARRHKALVGVAAIAVVMLAIFSGVGVVLLAREQARTSAALAEANRNSMVADRNYQRAEQHLQQARAAIDRFGVGLSDQLAEIPGAESVRRDVLLDSVRYYQQLVRDAGESPELQHETALAHFKTAVLKAKLGSISDAIGEYQAAQKALERLASAETDASKVWPQLAVLHNNLGLLYAAQANTAAANQEYEEAISIQQRLIQRNPGDTKLARSLAESQTNLGLLLDQVGKSKDAARWLAAAAARLRPLVKRGTNHAQFARDLAIVLNNFGYVLRNQDRDAAERTTREAITILEGVDHNSVNTEGRNDLALCYNNLAALLSQNGNWQEAIKAHQLAIDLQEQVVRKSPGVVRLRGELATSLNNLGVAYCRISQIASADEAFRRSRDIFAKLAEDYPEDLTYCSSLAAQLNNQALAMAGASRHAEALPIYRAAIEAQLKCRKRAPQSSVMRELLSKMYYNYGQSLRAEKKWQDAVAAVLARRELWRDDGERLLSVAAEMADLDDAVHKQEPVETQELTLNLTDRVLDTLQLVYDSGWRHVIDPIRDQRFAPLVKNERFAAKIAELNQRIAKASSN